jgi:hypothetical protein
MPWLAKEHVDIRIFPMIRTGLLMLGLSVPRVRESFFEDGEPADDHHKYATNQSGKEQDFD